MLLLFACKTISPKLPASVIDDLPEIKNKTSSLTIPIEIDLSPYLKDVEKTLGMTISGKEDNCKGVNYYYRFDREPINFSGKGQYFNYQVNGKYLLKLNYCPECTYLFDGKGNCVIPRVYASCGVGEAMRRASVAYATKVSVNDQFNLDASTTLKKFETPDACEITVFQYDATSKLRKEVTIILKDLEEDIDKIIEGVDIKSEVEKIWNELNKAQNLQGYGWLYIQPKQVSVSDVTFNEKKAYVKANILFQPLISTEKIETPKQKLPKPTEFKSSEGFEIQADIKAGYDSINSIFNQKFKNYQFDFKNKTINIDSVNIHSTNGKQINLAIKFSGDKKGILYLNGTPTYDEINQILSFPDMNFDLETKSALLKSAKWMFNDKITNLIRQQATLDLKPHLESIKAELSKNVNTEIDKGIFLKGNIDQIKVNQIFPTAQFLIIRAFTSGKIELKM